MAMVLALGFVPACSNQNSSEVPGDSSRATRQATRGSLSRRTGTATVRESYVPRPDDPATTNDESNDQPTGHFGTVTLIVSQQESGNTYTLDVELDGYEVQRIYFPKGGWVDLEGCDLDGDLTGDCVDENGKHWTFEGPAEHGD